MSTRTFWVYVASVLAIIFGVLIFHAGIAMDTTVPGVSAIPGTDLTVRNGQQVLSGELILTKLFGLMGASLIILSGVIGMAAALVCHTIEASSKESEGKL